MGYGFMVWAVDVGKLREVCGGKDDELRRMICGRFERDLASLDDMFGGSPSAHDAVGHLIEGAELKGNGALYAYAFKTIVDHFGRFLDNTPVCPWNGADFEPLDSTLSKMGVPFALERFYGFSLPVKLPYPDDFPMAGWVSNEDTAKIAAAFEAATVPAGLGPDAAELVLCVRGWFTSAAAQKRGLVSFYH